jgi:electron transfer flavoprotein alpha/beta subunit
MHIDPHDLAPELFSLAARLRRGRVVGFVVFRGLKRKIGDSDETALEAAINLEQAKGQVQMDSVIKKSRWS